MLWFLTYMTEHTKIPYQDILEMDINIMMDYFKQKQNLFVKTEREKIDNININNFRMTKEDEDKLERGEI